MKILFVTFSDINICSSSNIRNISLIKGFLDEGNSVDIVTYKTSNKALLADKSFLPVIEACNIFPIFGHMISEKVSSGLLSSGGDLKAKLYGKLRKLYYSLETVDSLRKVALNADIESLNLGKYDLMVSSSNPYSVHILADRIKKRYFKGGIKWIQYWGDALYFDTLTRRPIFPHRVKKAEKKLFSDCDKIVYTNGVVLEMQKKLFPTLADKMSFVETPFAFTTNENENTEYSVGYFGSFSSLVRDIVPLKNVLSSAEYSSVIIGNGDVPLQSEHRLTVMPRASVDVVSEYERKTEILVCICNKLSRDGAETGLIPGKAYHYGATNKKVLVIGATPKVKEFLIKYNRYSFAENEEKAISAAVKELLISSAKPTPLSETNPSAAAKKMLQSV